MKKIDIVEVLKDLKWIENVTLYENNKQIKFKKIKKILISEKKSNWFLFTNLIEYINLPTFLVNSNVNFNSETVKNFYLRKSIQNFLKSNKLDSRKVSMMALLVKNISEVTALSGNLKNDIKKIVEKVSSESVGFDLYENKNDLEKIKIVNKLTGLSERIFLELF